MEMYVNYAGKQLRKGYTTGTCAAAAAKAAVLYLSNGVCPPAVVISTAEGELSIAIVCSSLQDDVATCCVRKDAGDDPDVTHGIIVCASVQLTTDMEIEIRGGKGVGRVTKPGLRVPVGEAAINPSPRKQIATAVRSVLPAARGAIVEITVPEGERIAQKTFNPRLGIVGGISILGTTGIVRPMSEEAYQESLALRLDMLAAQGVERCAFTFGEYGKDLAAVLQLKQELCVTTSNFVGYMFDHAVAKGFKQTLFIGHLGKIIKVSAGIWHTHNRQADARLEILTAYAGLAGASVSVLEEISTSVTTSAVVDILDREGLSVVYQRVADSVRLRCTQRTQAAIDVEVIVYTDNQRILAQTAGADTLIRQLSQDSLPGQG